MASSLGRKLALMNNGAKPANQAPQSSPKIYEWSCEADKGLYDLNRDALIMMGYDGESFDISRAVFIDTETTGLSGGAGTVAFLVGIGYAQDGRFTVKQYLMPDYSCEADMLIELSKELKRFDIAVHFNGRRFDMPLLSQRCVMKRMEDFTDGMSQLDLLYPARSVWKLRLGSCRLSRLESEVLGMPERDDIPGGEIPARYFESVKKQDISLLNDVIEHNRQDIVTLTTLLVKLNELYSEPEEVTEQIDIFSLGKAFERQGEYRMARKLYLKASTPRAIVTVGDLKREKYAGDANLRLYLLERRRGDYEKCEQTLLNMIKRGQLGSLPRLELCKLYEHRLRRLDEALQHCEILLNEAKEDDREALQKRRDRIKSKLEKRGGKANV